MSIETPDALMARLTAQRARGEAASPQDLARLALANNEHGLGECGNAGAIWGGLKTGDKYQDAVMRTSNHAPTSGPED